MTMVPLQPSGQSAPKTLLDDERLLAASRIIDIATRQTEFHVPGMHCIGCVRRIERELSKLPGVNTVRANLSTRRVRVTWEPANTVMTSMSAELDRQGFEHNLLQLGTLTANDDKGALQHLLLCLGVAGFAAANVMLLSVSVWSGADAETRQLFHLISGLIAVPAAIFAGRPFFSSATNALAHARLNMDVPISLAIVLALAMSIWESLHGGQHAYFDAALMLLFFLLIGRTLDYMMRERARNAVKLLAGLAAKGAVRIEPDGSQHYVPADDIKPGDRIHVAAGERVPVDGTVRGTSSDIDRSLVTGESANVLVADGATIEAGTLNLTCPLVVEASKTAGDSFLAEVIAMMEAAENGKAKYQRIADRAAAIYAPAVHLLALLAFIAWLISSNGDWQMSAYVAISVLIITCPCSLGLAVPIVHVIGAGRLFDRGVLIKDGSGFERLSEVHTVVFDKTGTLTKGELTIVNTIATEAQTTLAATLARTSRHPAARAIAALVPELANAVAPALSSIQEHPGLGIEALLNGRSVRLGRPSWVGSILSNPVVVPNDTTVWLADHNGDMAAFAMVDQLRADAIGTIRQLQNDGLDVQILSGDTAAVVRETAQRAGIEAYYAEQKPADKIAHLERLRHEGRRVLMVGDGLNDAPALAASHVSMAPSSGSDVGRQAADFVLTGEGIAGVAFARNIARRTNSLVKQNIAIAIAYNCIAVPLACAGLVTPLIAAISMSASSVIVVANSMRLRLGSADTAEFMDNTELNLLPDHLETPIFSKVEA
jgi:Cu2+-exporting ATPase